jgi:diguanylate cyclase (GGDEF)-like protein
VDDRRGRPEAAGRLVTALIVDMDKLKLINDTGGHAAGDRAVLAVAEAVCGAPPG